MMRLHNILLAAAVVASGCESAERGCRDDRGCAVGDACVNGQCRPVVGADLGAADAAVADGAQLVDFSPPVPDGWSPDALAASCTFNGNGVLERGEAPFIPNLGGLFATNPSGSTQTVNVVPQGGAWDFSAPISNERKVFDQLIAPGSAWWAAEFSGATHAQKLDDSSAMVGVYRATPTALELLGVASEQSGASQTLLKYATPIEVLKFPLMTGSSWTSESDVSGTAQGLFFAAHEKYVLSVDLRGNTKVPAGVFDTLRLRIGYTQTYGFLVTTRITYLHLAECYGAVARVRSRDNESMSDFTQASEYRRLSTP
jgi:hypothetical protein